MEARFAGIRIAGVLGVVPARIRRFDDEMAGFGHSPESSRRLKAAMGYDEHRVAPPGVTTSDLALAGVERLRALGALDPAGLDALFLVTQTPDHVIPATSAWLHGRLGLSQDAYCIDIADGCNGWIKGLYEAAAFLAVTGGRRALLVAGDVLSHRVSPHDRNSWPLVGDAATLTLLERAEADDPHAALRIEIRNDGRGWDKLIVPAGGARRPSGPDTRELHADEEGNRRSAEHLVMQGRDVFAFTQTVVSDFLLDFMARHAASASNVDLFALHQANAFILDRIRRKLGVGADKLPDAVVRRYGNSSSGTIPMTLAAAPLGADGPTVLACGFGVGLSWGAALFRLGRLGFHGIVEHP